jgi:quinol monooxygenase YgiN
VLIVAGVFEVEPEQRDAFIAGRAEGMQISRSEPGCIEYAFSADPLVPGKVLLFEIWEDKASLAAHIAAAQARGPGEPAAPAVKVLRSEILQYDIGAVGPLGS